MPRSGPRRHSRAAVCVLAVLAFSASPAAGSNTSTLLSVNRTGTAGGNNDTPFTSAVEAVTPDGLYAVFSSPSTDLTSDPDTSGATHRDLFIRDQSASPTTVLISKKEDDSGAAGGVLSGRDAEIFVTDSMRNGAQVSDDGRYVVFAAESPELTAAGDTNGGADVYRWDSMSGTVDLVSVATGGSAGNGISQWPRMSADGQRIVFLSKASDLDSGVTDGNGDWDVFLRDFGGVPETRTISSVPSGATTGDAASGTRGFTISADGDTVAFSSEAVDLDPLSAPGAVNVYTRAADLSDTTALVCEAMDGTDCDASSSQPNVSDDGRYVTFGTSATNLAGTPPGQFNIFRKDRTNGEVELVNRRLDGGGAGNDHANSSGILSGDGDTVVFASRASDLTANPDPGGPEMDLFVRRLSTDTTRLLTRDTSGNALNTYAEGGIDGEPYITADGRYTSFGSPGPSLTTTPDSNGALDVFRYDYVADSNELVSTNPAGTAAATGGPGSPSGDSGPHTGDDEGRVGFRSGQQITAVFNASNPYQEYLSDTPTGGGPPPPAVPVFTVQNSSVSEGAGPLRFEAKLSTATASTVTVRLTTSDGTAFSAAGTGRTADYTARNDVITFTPGTTSVFFDVTLTNNEAYEKEETLSVAASDVTAATVGDGTAIGTITDDDPRPELIIEAATVSEVAGDTSAQVPLTVTGATEVPFSVKYQTADDSAKAGTDYKPVAGTLTAAGTVTVPLIEDTIREDSERFFVQLSDPVEAGISGSQAFVTITDDDFGPFEVNEYSPRAGGDTGYVTLSIRAEELVRGTTAELVRADETIPGQNTTILAIRPHLGVIFPEVRTTFDLRGAQRGRWDLVVTTPSGRTSTVPFTVEAGVGDPLEFDLQGQDAYLRSKPEFDYSRYPFTAEFRNSSNIDSPPRILALVADFPQDSRILRQERSTIEAYGEPAPNLTANGRTILPLVIPTVASGDLGYGRVNYFLRGPLAEDPASLGFTLRVLERRFRPAVTTAPSGGRRNVRPARARPIAHASQAEEAFVFPTTVLFDPTFGVYESPPAATDPPVGTSAADQAGLNRALEILNQRHQDHFGAGGGSLPATGAFAAQAAAADLFKTCREVTAERNDALKSAAGGGGARASGRSPLAGWKVAAITGLAGQHTMTLLTSPRGNHYGVDNYWRTAVLPLTPDPDEADTWQIDRGAGSARVSQGTTTSTSNDDYLSLEIETGDSNWTLTYPDVGSSDAAEKCDDECEPPEEVEEIEVEGKYSYDPNDKLGPAGAGAARFISTREPLDYKIRFENVETATAAANEVVVTDQLDTTLVDPASVSLGPVRFGFLEVTPPVGAKTFQEEIDLRPERDLIVRVSGSFNAANGLLTWRLLGLDPETGEQPEDAALGFLDPNKVPPEGDGSVSFSAQPKQDVATGAKLSNGARIVFDVNPPIDTPVWTNTFDGSTPSSRVRSVRHPAGTPRAGDLQVQWGGRDRGSGIKSFDVFVSVDGGRYRAWRADTPEGCGIFNGVPGRSYRFYSVADDYALNSEGTPRKPDARFKVRPRGRSVRPEDPLETYPNVVASADPDVDDTPPCVSGLGPSKRRLPARGGAIKFGLSERGRVRFTLQRELGAGIALRRYTRGGGVRTRCVPRTKGSLRKLRRQLGRDPGIAALRGVRRKVELDRLRYFSACTRYKPVRAKGLKAKRAGRTRVALGRKRLRSGTYLASVVATDRAGNRSLPARTRIKVARRPAPATAGAASSCPFGGQARPAANPECDRMRVTVKGPSEVTLEQLDGAAAGIYVPRPLTFTVTVRNTGRREFIAHPPSSLSAGDLAFVTAEAEKATIAPRGTGTFRYAYLASKPGTSTVQASVVGVPQTKNGPLSSFTGQGSTEVAVLAGLNVEITTQRKTITVQETPERPAEEYERVTVKVTNPNSEPADDVTVQDLDIEWKTKGVKAPKVLPLRSVLENPPEGVKADDVPPQVLGSIRPRGSDEAKFLLKATGDGDFELTANASGVSADGERLRGSVRKPIKVRTPLLFMYAKVDRRVNPSRDQGKLVAAGSAFSIRIRLVNRSNRETLSVEPFLARVAGNAAGGYLQPRPEGKALPIHVGGPAVLSPGTVAAAYWYVLKPREEREIDAVVHTRPADDALELEKPAADGSTSARAAFSKPIVHTIELGDKTITAKNPTGQKIEIRNNKQKDVDPDLVVLAKGAELHEVRVAPVPYLPTRLLPSEYIEAPANLAHGGVQALGLAAGAFTQGLFALKTASGQALGGWLARVQTELEQEAELFRLLNTEEFKDVYIKQVRKNDAEALADFEKIGGAPKQVLDAMGDALVAADRKAADIAHNWYEGDWRKAMRDLGVFTVQPIAEAVLVDRMVAFALGRLISMAPRLKPLVNAVAESKIARSRALKPVVKGFIKVRNKARVIRAWIKHNLKPGYVAHFDELPQMYGIRVGQAEKFADLAHEHGVIFTVRSRAAESLKWLDEAPPNGPAYFKPEFIKVKNVTHYDIEYLGFPESGRGRVMFSRNLPTEAQVRARLDADGVDDFTRDSVLGRLKLRQEELTSKKPGQVQELEGFHKEKIEIESEFNWRDNGLDPGFKEKRTKAKFELEEDPAGSGVYAIKVELDGAGGYKSVTGDIDIVDITYANGMPLSPEDTIKILTQLRDPPISIQHPYTATWWNDGKFDFDQKHFELGKEDPIQFGPDARARVVRYDKSKSNFTCGQFDYRVFWTGGYRNLTSSPLSIFTRPASSPCAGSSTRPGRTSYTVFAR